MSKTLARQLNACADAIARTHYTRGSKAYLQAVASYQQCVHLIETRRARKSA